MVHVLTRAVVRLVLIGVLASVMLLAGPANGQIGDNPTIRDPAAHKTAVKPAASAPRPAAPIVSLKPQTRSQPTVARMSTLDVTTAPKCSNGGMKTRLGMMEHSAANSMC
jgi:hypothetical protein